MPLGANKVALLGSSGVVTDTSILLATGVASASASIEFTLPTAYKQVKFGFYNITPATNAQHFQFQVNASGQTGYNETVTSTSFQAGHAESDSWQHFQKIWGSQAQGTGYELLMPSVGNGADMAGAGELVFYDPASTIYVKQFHGVTSSHYDNPGVNHSFYGGYINTTTNLSGISFKFSSGNIASGTIKMWGIR